MSDSVRELFEAYADYIGYDSVEDLKRTSLYVWECDACDVQVPVATGDPHGYGPVLCPECGAICEVVHP